MNISEKNAELYKALTAALAELTNPARTAENPFFKSKYAPLHSTLDAVRAILGKHGLAVMQSAQSSEGRPAIVTCIIHESGQWIKSEPLVMKPSKDDPQGHGGALTYARRYSLEAMLGICGDEDDDANYATQPSKPKAAPPKPAQPTVATTPPSATYGPDYILRSGPHSGTKLRDVPVEWLNEQYATTSVPAWKAIVRAELERRKG